MSAAVKSWLIGRLTLASLQFSMGCEVGRAALAKVQDAGLRAARGLALLVDSDDAPCANCGLPGGTHIDCDDPSAGTMTATERRHAFDITPPGPL